MSSCRLDSSESISSSSDIICSDYDIAIIIMLSTPFEHQVYLGYSSTEKVQQPSIQNTYLGGQPLFLTEPKKQDLLCNNCINQTLTFICQVFCPLQAEHCYNRILYIFYCQRCRREFKCLKHQSSEDQPINTPKIDTRTIKEQACYIQSQPIEIKQLLKIKNKAKREVQEDIIAQKEEQEFDSEEEGVEVKEIEIDLGKLGLGKEESFQEEIGQNKMANLKQMSQNMQENKKQQKDAVFEQYRRAMKYIDDPVLLYSNIPIPYNNQPINPQHSCKYCKAKLSLELQITQKILLVSPKLIDLDWGCLLVFTCSNSCKESSEECLVVQYETDAVQDSQINALKKRNKNKKRKEKSKQKKDLSKQKQKEKKEAVVSVAKEEEGDWD